MTSLLMHRRRFNVGPTSGGGGGGGGTQTKTYAIDYTTDFPNPERGWYVENTGDTDFTSGENNPSPVSGVAPAPTLQMRYVDLRSHRTSDYLPTATLNELARQMAAWRSSGRKAILRYAYNRGPATSDNDATLARTLNHIAQLGPLWHEYQDVIAVLQAGFIGRWGEWNSSSSGNLTKANRNAVIDALLAAAPVGLPIQLRKPLWHYDRWATPLPSGEAWTGTPRSRAGMMNDSFLAGTGHGGTFYDGDGMTFAQMRAYWAAIAPYTPYGGESSELGGIVDAVNGGTAAIAEMAAYQMDYLNSEFWKPMLDKWASDGKLAEISRRLGYRLALEEATLPTTAAPGAPLTIQLKIQNIGFGKLYRPRYLDLVLIPASGPASTLTLTSNLHSDLPAGGQTRTITYTGALGAGAAPGNYNAYLRLRDRSPLANDVRYCIRLANNGMWDGLTGRNDLNAIIAVSP